MSLRHPGLRRVLDDIRKRGVSIEVEGGRLRVRGRLTEAETGLLRAQREHVIALLAQPLAGPLEIPDEEIDLPASDPDADGVEEEEEEEVEEQEEAEADAGPTGADWLFGLAYQTRDPATGRWVLRWSDERRSREMSAALRRGPVSVPAIGYGPMPTVTEETAAPVVRRPARKGSIR